MNEEQLKALSVKDLKAKCKEMKLKGYSRLSEADLIKLILANQPAETDDLDELLDGPDEAVEPEAVEPEAVEPEAVEPEAVEPEAVEPEAVEPEAVEPEADEDGKVEFKKLIKGAFGHNGETFKGSTFKLTAEEAKHPKIKTAIRNKLIKIK